MTAVIQRVRSASVTVVDPDGSEHITGTCGNGLMILLGVERGDDESDADIMAAKISKLRIFSDADGHMNLSVIDVGGSALVVSNFTLCAEYRRGNRPDFFGAAPPDEADALYIRFSEKLRELIGRVENGEFGADMRVSIENDGPVTLVLESAVLKGPKKG